MSLVEAAVDEVERLPVDYPAKRQIRELREVCVAFGGNFSVTPPRPEYNDHFASASCRLPQEVLLNEVRLASKLELLGEDFWRTVHEIPDTVVWMKKEKEPMAIKRFYLDNRGGVDIVEGQIPLKGFHAYVQENGKYINMELV